MTKLIWRSPLPSWIKANSDGLLKGKQGSAACEAVTVASIYGLNAEIKIFVVLGGGLTVWTLEYTHLVAF
ncbi:hypothetical protein Q3G72_031660 [Acer saccharum]|nr:hypothetical protein Q3G72_031660 [Acer saccharum]